MKTSLKVGIGFTVGLALGLAPAVEIWINREWLMGYYSCIMMTELVLNARQLKNGKVDEVLGRYEEAIPPAIVTVHSNFMSDPGAMGALWAAQQFYEENPTSPLSEEAKHVLASLPPRPPTSCELKPKTGK